MRHLYHSRVEVRRLDGEYVNGTLTQVWKKVDTVLDPLLGVPGELMCRLDLNFVRPGKDQPMPIQAGRAPDRIGLMFFDTTDDIKAGDMLHTVAGPVTGTFEIRVIPDPAVGFAAAHHMEVQIVEVAQALRGRFPGAEPEEML